MSQIDDLKSAVDAALLEANKSVANAVNVMTNAIAVLTGLENPGPNPVIADAISRLTAATDSVATTLDTATSALDAAVQAASVPAPTSAPAA